MNKERVIKILMRRDGVSRKEAIEMINDCLMEIEAGNYNAMSEILELEDDYIFDLL